MTAGIGGWDLALPQRSVVLPTGGSQLPGSGTTVFGANQFDGSMPSELVAASYAGSAIIWYSGPTESGYRYDFIAHTAYGGTGDIVSGWVDSTGIIHQTTNLQGDLFLIQNVLRVQEKTGLLSYMNFNPATGHLYIAPPISNPNGNPAAMIVGAASLRSDGVNSYLTDNSGLVDVYQNRIVTNGVFGGQTFTGGINIYNTYDRMIQVTGSITFTVAPTAGILTLANVIPVAYRQFNPNDYIIGACVSQVGTPLVCRLDNVGNIVLFGVPASTGFINYTATYPIAKPTF